VNGHPVVRVVSTTTSSSHVHGETVEEFLASEVGTMEKRAARNQRGGTSHVIRREVSCRSAGSPREAR
jgi:hypothetical protein